jgi:hypothetical protein
MLFIVQTHTGTVIKVVDLFQLTMSANDDVTRHRLNVPGTGDDTH